jgi:hypothetical protein
MEWKMDKHECLSYHHFLREGVENATFTFP